MFFLLLIWKRSLCIYVESFFFPSKRGVIGNPYFQWMHLSNCTNLSKKITHWARKAFECTKKKKSFNSMHSLCFIVSFAIYKWALSFLFVCNLFFFFILERICDRFFSVDYIWVPHAFIESYVKWIKKKNILQFSQIYFANMGYYFIESRGKSQYLDVIYEK